MRKKITSKFVAQKFELKWSFGGPLSKLCVTPHFLSTLDVKLKTRWAITGSWEPLVFACQFWKLLNFGNWHFCLPLSFKFISETKKLTKFVYHSTVGFNFQISINKCCCIPVSQLQMTLKSIITSMV
jgi:hypothetical protein